MVNIKTKLGQGDPKLSAEALKLLDDDPCARENAYSDKVAAIMASVAGWSYGNLEDFQRVLSDKLNFSEADFVEISATNHSMLIVGTSQIIRTSDRKTAVVCFRGTEPTNLVNWGTDLNARKVPYLDKKIKVHQGFLANFRSVWDGNEGILSYLRNPSKMTDDDSLYADELENIFITGHSLGGAMAFLAALHLSVLKDLKNDTLWDKVRGVYTYGQPMVIDTFSSNECDRLIGDRLFRHVFYNDIVPHVPTIAMGLYAHVGHEYRYRPSHKWKKIEWGKVTQVPVGTPTLPFIAWDALGSSVIFPFSLFKSPWSITDHLPNNYINSLNGIGGGDVRGLATFGGLMSNDEDEVQDEILPPTITA